MSNWNKARLSIYRDGKFDSESIMHDAIGYSTVLLEIFGKDVHRLMHFSFEEIKEDFEKIFKKFSLEKIAIISLRYGLDGSDTAKISDIAEFFNYDYSEKEIRRTLKEARREIKEYFITEKNIIFLCNEAELIRRIEEIEHEQTEIKWEFREKMANLEDELNQKKKELFLLTYIKEDSDTWRRSLENQPIDFCDFSVRTYNCLKRAGINTIGDLVKFKESDFIRIRNFGRNNMEEVKKFLSDNFLSLKPEDKKD